MKSKKERIEDMVENPTSSRNIKKYRDYKIEKDGMTKSQKEGMRISRIIFWTIFACLLVFNLTTNFVKVDGYSMEPNFYDGELFFVKKGITPAPGEVIVFKQDMTSVGGDGEELLIKRVMAKGGDTVEIKDGNVYINGEFEDKAAVDGKDENGNYKYSTEEAKWVLAEDELFVMGDNRLPGASVDSRYFGPINESQIKGTLTEEAEGLTKQGRNFETLFPRIFG